MVNIYLLLSILIRFLLIYRGGREGVDEGIFPRQMVFEWIRFYQLGGGSPNTINLSGRAIALRSNANGKFVSADNGGNSPLIANRDNAQGWERFDLIQLNGNNIALKSHANQKYVCAENGGNSSLIANRSEISGWETFQLIDRGNGKVSLIAVNGKYVCADNFGQNELIANRDGANEWETFDLIEQ